MKRGSCLLVASDLREHSESCRRLIGRLSSSPPHCNVCANKWPCAEIPLRLLSIHVNPSPADFQTPVRDWQTPTCQTRRRRVCWRWPVDALTVYTAPHGYPALPASMTFIRWTLLECSAGTKSASLCTGLWRAALSLFPHGSSLPGENHSFLTERGTPYTPQLRWRSWVF